LPTEHVECRSAADCEGDALCVLSGYTAAPRGNEEMHAFCDGPGMDEDALAARYHRDPAERDGPQTDANVDAGLEEPVDNTTTRLLAALEQ
jgi:hypothetical protein